VPAFREWEGEIGDSSYIDAIAREFGTSRCVRCSGQTNWGTAALLYESMEWDFYYCYECRRWFKRHFKFRYQVAPVDDKKEIKMLTHFYASQREMINNSLQSTRWIRKALRSLKGLLKRGHFLN
jgi:hypothetical protein